MLTHTHTHTARTPHNFPATLWFHLSQEFLNLKILNSESCTCFYRKNIYILYTSNPYRKAMSDLFTTFDSNSGHHHDTPMASPSQHSPMTNNSNSSTQNGGTTTTSTTGQAVGGSVGVSGKTTNHSPATGAENTPVSTIAIIIQFHLIF